MQIGRAVRIGGAAGLLALASQVDVPMVPVPMTLQSLALLGLAGLLGAREAALAVALWLLAAAAGAPVLAGGEGGLARLGGPTAGYLAAFPIVALGVGALGSAGYLRQPAPALGVMLLAHVVILALGFAWLQRSVGVDRAWHAGVAPFLLGVAVKSALAAALVVYGQRQWSRGREIPRR